MDDEAWELDAYKHDSYLPCDLKEIVSRVRRKPIADKDVRLGLERDITAIPLNRGYLIRTMDVMLRVRTLQPLYKLNGTLTAEEISSSNGVESFLEQLHYYGLLSFGTNRGLFIYKDVPMRYRQLYERGDFVEFPLVPMNVELDVTNSCNFFCIHCSKDSKARDSLVEDGELSLDEQKRLIHECAQIGVVKVILMGGEPLCSPHFMELVKYAKAEGIRNLGSSTNGWFITDQVARQLSQYFDDIQVSIHGASSSTHDAIVGRRGAWRRAFRAVKALKEHGLKVNVSFTVMRENLDDMHRMPDLVKQNGGDSLRFLCLNDQEGRARLLDGWSIEDIFEIGKQLRTIYESRPIGLEMEAGGFPPLRPIQNDASSYGCPGGRTLLSVAPDGRVRICGSVGNDVGDVVKRSVLDIWHSPRLVEMRRQSECDCNYRSICYGTCQVKG